MNAFQNAYFNSTMVQFWGFEKTGGRGVCRISIPLWCNFGGTLSLQSVSALIFQFHYGAILGYFQFGLDGMMLISIPLWCNFGNITDDGYACEIADFNSTMVQFWVF